MPSCLLALLHLGLPGAASSHSVRLSVVSSIAAASLALRGELENEVFSALALLITKLWTIYCFEGQKAFQNEYLGMIRVRYINTTIPPLLVCLSVNVS